MIWFASSRRRGGKLYGNLVRAAAGRQFAAPKRSKALNPVTKGAPPRLSWTPVGCLPGKWRGARRMRRLAWWPKGTKARTRKMATWKHQGASVSVPLIIGFFPWAPLRSGKHETWVSKTPTSKSIAFAVRHFFAHQCTGLRMAPVKFGSCIPRPIDYMMRRRPFIIPSGVPLAARRGATGSCGPRV